MHANRSLGSGAAGDSILRSIRLSTFKLLEKLLMDRPASAYLMRSSWTLPLPDNVANIITIDGHPHFTTSSRSTILK